MKPTRKTPASDQDLCQPGQHKHNQCTTDGWACAWLLTSDSPSTISCSWFLRNHWEGLSRYNRKRPDGRTLIPWCTDRSLSHMGCDGVLHDCQLLPGSFIVRGRRCRLQPSSLHQTRWPSMLDSHYRVNFSQLRWSPTAQSTGILLSSWVSWAGDWCRQLGMFEQLFFCSNKFPLWCNDLILFLLMTTGQSRMHYQTNFCNSFCNFWATRGFPWLKNNNGYNIWLPSNRLHAQHQAILLSRCNFTYHQLSVV